MTEPFYQPKPIEMKKGKRYPRAGRIALIAVASMAAALFVFLSWQKFRPGPFKRIESLMESGQWEDAAQTAYELAQKGQDTNLRLLMLGSVINYALAQSDIPLTGNIPFYEYEKQLLSLDETSIFTSQSYIYKFRFFPQARDFTRLFCEFIDQFGDRDPGPSGSGAIANALALSAFGRDAKSQCIAALLGSPLGARYSGVTTADRINVRNSPNLDSSVVGKLNRDAKVVVLEKGAAQEIDQAENYWYRIATPQGIHGWIFGAFLDQGAK